MSTTKEDAVKNKFAKMIEQERERLTKALGDCNERKAAIDAEIAGIQQEMKAVAAYEAATTGKAVATTTGKRHTGIRGEVLAKVKAHRKGIGRAPLLEEMGVKGDKSGEKSVSNALAALKKAGNITAEDGVYKAAP